MTPMGRAIFIVPAGVAAVLVAAAIGIYAYDSARVDRVAEGVTVGGVDIGGMTADDARDVLDDAISEPLQRAVKVKAAGRAYELSAKDAQVRVDVDSLVDSAVAASRAPSLPARSFRDLSGGSLDLALGAKPSYSKKAVSKLVATVAEDVDRVPSDATVEPTSTGLSTTAGKDGRKLSAGALEKDVRTAVLDPDAEHRISAEVATVAPEVTEKQLAGQTPYFITVDRSSFKLRFYRNLELDKTYDIAVGAQGYDTPTGLYDIQSKQVDPVWYVPEEKWAGKLAGKTIPGGAANNPLKARWMGFNGGAGIHGTSDAGSIGSAASHGCIRMRVPDVIDLYDRVEVSTPVYIG